MNTPSLHVRFVVPLACGLIFFGLILAALQPVAHAGGPKYVAGASYFNPGIAGQPIRWENGVVTYYTDQGNLSPLLSGSAADAFVADAFSRWTSVPTAALFSVRAGQLAEDVNGSNVVRNSDGSITMPADIQPTALDHPVGVIYDADGQVTNALLGTGAGDRASCFSNAVFGGPDTFTADGSIAHALVVLNGNCIQVQGDVVESKYRLVRVLGSVLGLDWSQLNLNVLSGMPAHPTADDKAGFPVMHGMDPQQCMPITLCYPNPDQLKMDDRAALAQLYPVTASNLPQFPGKQISSATTARIHGSVYFTDLTGNPAQPMQCVNVVARWIDPNTGQPSGQYAAASVSGFLFARNAGNPVTGYLDPTGNRYDRFGSNDPTLEGTFDLTGLEIPQSNTGQYQLSVEALDPMYSDPVGPCASGQVSPSGTFTPIVVTVAPGTDLQQNILMSGSAVEKDDPNRDETYATPFPIPNGGSWYGRLSGYGDVDYFRFAAQANRTFSVDVFALDESSRATQLKARPVVGVWFLGDTAGSLPVVSTPSPFNTGAAGLSQLNIQVQTSSMLRLGIADFRGDGRPDFQYRAQLLYGDSVTPSRVSVSGGNPVSISGVGFKPGISVTVGNTPVKLLSVSDQQIIVLAPAYSDSTQSITIRNPATGAQSVLQNALIYGAAPTDSISISNSNSAIPVGTQTAYPIRAMVMTGDGLHPVVGATVQWSVSNGGTLSICGNAVCYATTDQQGRTDARVNVNAQGNTTVTAQLAPSAYPGKSAQVILASTTENRSISVQPFRLWAMQGTSTDVPLTAHVVTSTGAPVSGLRLSFAVTLGTGTVNPSAVTTDSNGNARSTLHVDSLPSEVDVVICSTTGGITCPTLSLLGVAPSSIRLQPVSGSHQIIPLGQSFIPLWVRAVDSSVPSNPISGVPVLFQSTWFRLTGTPVIPAGSDDNRGSNPAQKVKLGSAQTLVSSDADGYAGIIPPNGNGTQALEVDVAVTTGTQALLNYVLQETGPVPTSTGLQTQAPGP